MSSKKGAKFAQIVIQPMSPFNFDGTVYVPHYFPTPDFEWQPNIMWQTLNLDRRLVGLKMENRGAINAPKIRLTVYSKNKLTSNVMERAVEELSWRYGFNEASQYSSRNSRMTSFSDQYSDVGKE